MYIETKRLIIRELKEQEAEELLEITNDKQVKKYHPILLKELFRISKKMQKKVLKILNTVFCLLYA